MPTDTDIPDAPEILYFVSQQFFKLLSQISKDISRNRDDDISREVIGFVGYHLTDQAGEPLKDLKITEAGLSINDLKNTDGFIRLKNYCDGLRYNLRLDAHFYADEPENVRILRVVVDGW